jgi:hypothetical protein
LEEGDVRIEIGVSVFSRVERLAELKIDRTLYGGEKSQSLLQDLDRILQEVYEPAAVKVNKKLDPDGGAQREAEWRAERARATRSKNDDLIGGPMPLPYPDPEETEHLFGDLDWRSR